MDDLNITKGAYHAITFESSILLSNFNQLLRGYFQNKVQSECLYLKILDSSGNIIKAKDCYFISFDCNIIKLEEEKSTKNLLQELLFFHLENNPDLLQEYIMFNGQIDRFLNQIEIRSKNIAIDFYSTEKTIKNFIKSLDIAIEYQNDEYVPNHVLREFLIRSLLKMNHLNKHVILLMSYPETDVGSNELQEVIHFLNNLEVTTIVITTNRDLLTAAKEESMFLVNKDGYLYDIINLKEELRAFGLVNEENLSIVAKTLAIHDFKKDYLLLNKRMKEFLLSSKF